MSEPKYNYRLPPCAPYDIPAMQSWLESMAAKGLHLAQDGFFCGIATFEIGSPRKEKFRLEATATNGGLFSEEYAPEDDAIQLNHQMGWTYRARRGQFHIYSASDPEAPELHTDPQVQAITIAALGKYLRQELWSTLLLIAFYAVFYFGDLTVSAAVTVGTWWVVLVLLLVLWSLGRQFRSILTLRKLRRQLLSGELPSHRSDYGRQRCLYPISRLGYLALACFAVGYFLIFAGQNLTDEKAVKLEDFTEPLPFATLSDLYPGAEVKQQNGILESQVTAWSDYLAPENYDYSEYAEITWEGQQFDCYLTVNYHRTRWDWVAERLAGEFISQAGGNLADQTADRLFGREPVTITEIVLPDADYCAYYYGNLHDPYIILQQNEIVLRIRLAPLGSGAGLEPEELARAVLAQIR